LAVFLVFPFLFGQADFRRRTWIFGFVSLPPLRIGLRAAPALAEGRLKRRQYENPGDKKKRRRKKDSTEPPRLRVRGGELALHLYSPAETSWEHRDQDLQQAY